jgi:hypothetical protein
MGRQKLDKQTWTSFRTELNNSYDFSDKWASVIKLFDDRIQDFYFKPIDKILKPNNRKGEGFSVLTLQCALIEMFAAFRQGMIHNHKRPRKNEVRPKYEYYDSDSCFVEFLQTEEIFEDHFYIKDKTTGERKPNPICNAKEFYGKVRCGLMHEARTKEDWLITAADTDTSAPNKFITYNQKDKTKKVNRTILQERLKTYFEKTYLKGLAEKNENGKRLRRLLARKLDHLHDIPSDKTFDWWKDK